MTRTEIIAALHAEALELQARYPSSTTQTGLVLSKRMVKIDRQLATMGEEPMMPAWREEREQAYAKANEQAKWDSRPPRQWWE